MFAFDTFEYVLLNVVEALTVISKKKKKKRVENERGKTKKKRGGEFLSLFSLYDRPVKSHRAKLARQRARNDV